MINIDKILSDVVPETPDSFRDMVEKTALKCTNERKKKTISIRFVYLAAIIVIVISCSGGVLAYSFPTIYTFLSSHFGIDENEMENNLALPENEESELPLYVNEVYVDGMNLCFTACSEDEDFVVEGSSDHVSVNGIDCVFEDFQVTNDGEYVFSVTIDKNILEGHEGDIPLTFSNGDEISVDMMLYVAGEKEKVPFHFKSVVGEGNSGYKRIPDQIISLKEGITASVHDSFISASMMTLNISFEGENDNNKSTYELYTIKDYENYYPCYYVEDDKGNRVSLDFSGQMGDEWNINIYGIGLDTTYLKFIPGQCRIDTESGKPNFRNKYIYEDYCFIIKL